MSNEKIIDTRRALFAGGARLNLVVAGLMYYVLAAAVPLTTAAIWTAVSHFIEPDEWLYTLSRVIDGALVLLFVMPLMYGFNTLAWRIYRDGSADTDCVFSAYRMLPRTWLVMLIQLIPAGLIASAVFMCIEAWRYIDGFSIMSRNSTVITAVHAGLVVTCVLIVVLFLVLAVRLYLLQSYAYRGDMSVADALARSWSASRGQIRRIIGFVMRYIGWAVLGVLSVGVLLIYRVIPCYYIEYNIFADELLKGSK